MNGGHQLNDLALVTTMAENSSDAVDWLESIGAGRAYNDRVHCNYGEYPLFQFDPEFLEDANPESFAGLLTE